MSPEACADADDRDLRAEVKRLRAALNRAEAAILSMGHHSNECRRAFDAWVQDEWEREHAQTGEQK